MEPEIIFVPSAFKHNVTEEDIHRQLVGKAFKTMKYNSPIEGDEDKFLLIGFNTSANPLEIMYNELDDGTACIFFGNLATAILPPQCHAGINLFRY